MQGLELGVNGKGLSEEVMAIGEGTGWVADEYTESLWLCFLRGLITSQKWFNLVTIKWALGRASASGSQLSTMVSTTP